MCEHFAAVIYRLQFTVPRGYVDWARSQLSFDGYTDANMDESHH